MVYRFDVEHIRDLALRLQKGLSLEGDDQRQRIEQILLKVELEREFILINYNGEQLPSLTELLYTVSDLAQAYHHALGVRSTSHWMTKIREALDIHTIPLMRKLPARNGVHIAAEIEKKYRARLLGSLGTSSELQLRTHNGLQYVLAGDAALFLGIHKDKIARLREQKLLVPSIFPEGNGNLHLYSLNDIEQQRQEIYAALINKQLPH